MPIYEYRCQHCRRRVSLFLRTFSSPASCPHCGSTDLARLVSRFAVLRSVEGSVERLTDDETWSEPDEQDPKKLARWARRMEQETGEKMEPEVEEMVSHMEQGEMPPELQGEVPLDEDESDFGES